MCGGWCNKQFILCLIMKITISNHIRVASFHIFGTIIMFLTVWLFSFEKDIIMMACCIWVIYTIPALYLHIDYYNTNNGEKIEIYYDKIIVKKRGEQIKYNHEDLDKIIIYKSASLDKGGIPLNAMECYNYIRITPKSGEDILITCLMRPSISEEILIMSGVKFERKKRFFCTTKWK